MACNNNYSNNFFYYSTSPLSDQSSDNYASTVTIVIIVSIVTIIAHVVLCVFNFYRRNGVGMSMSRAEIRRELMEKREWERMMEQLGTNWNSDSD